MLGLNSGIEHIEVTFCRLMTEYRKCVSISDSTKNPAFTGKEITRIVM